MKKSFCIIWVLVLSNALGVFATNTGLVFKTLSIIDFKGSNFGEQLIKAVAVLPASGGKIDCRDLKGTQFINSQILIQKNNVTILLGDCTVILDGVKPTQVPPGAVLLIRGNNFNLKGIRDKTFLKMARGCQASAIALYQNIACKIQDIVFDGNKYNVEAQKDDTWSSAITMICFSEKQMQLSKHKFNHLEIKNFVHYGLLTYGNTCSGNLVKNCKIYGNGNVTDKESTGSGICINKNSSNNIIKRCEVFDNKNSGFFLCNAGGKESSYNNKILKNKIYGNGVNGIWIIEQSNFSSSPNTGNKNVTIKNNSILNNSESGIRIGTYDNVGLIENVLIKRNNISNNLLYGIILQSTLKSASTTRNISIINNTISNNNLIGIFNSENVEGTIIKNNILFNNKKWLVDSGKKSLIIKR